MEEQGGTDGSTEKQKLHDDIARIKAALQSDEDGISGDESDVGSDDDGHVASEDGTSMAGLLLSLVFHFFGGETCPKRF